ncbi:MAG: M20/M25/M40 family metallo-hydrolase [Anaerolineaceae bacterium]|nr:M20/M25/M40 family metallo-hydrolase [Anaerolineaceae bacterium]
MIDWQSIEQQAAQLLSRYLKIDTTNPPGNETLGADFLEQQLNERRITLKRFDSAKGRTNLIARLPGNGSKKPVLLYHHMDVVEADASQWSCDPFGGEIRDGYVWGRGAIDMKGMGIMHLLALDLLKKHMPDRSRDIILLAASDEEMGGKYGTQWLIEHHWPEIDAEYMWDEGSFGLQDFFDEMPVFAIAVAEKNDIWLKLVAHGTAGHSGMPHGDNAAEILMRALNKIMDINTQYELTPITRQLFANIGSLKKFPQSFLLKHLNNPLIFRFLRPTLASDNTISAILRDTISITVLQAGAKENIIPESAAATLDIRLLPDRDPQAFLDGLKQLINDERVEFVHHADFKQSHISDTQSEFYNTLSTVLQELVPDSISTPMLTPGATDSCFFRQNGVNAYGLFPAIITPDELARFHNVDERISLENLGLGTRITYEVLKRLCA